MFDFDFSPKRHEPLSGEIEGSTQKSNVISSLVMAVQGIRPPKISSHKDAKRILLGMGEFRIIKVA